MSHRRFLVSAVVVCTLLVTGPVHGQGKLKKADLQSLLSREMETKDFTTPMTMRDFLQLVYERFAATGDDLSIILDIASFKAENPESDNPFNAQVSLPSNPRRLPLSRILQLVVDQLPNSGAIVLRNGGVEIVSRSSATLPVMLWQKVLVKFDEVPMVVVMKRLAHQSGISIVVDPRVKEKKELPISADFRGDVTVESVLRMVANMADLNIVLMDRAVFVTTRENAATLEKELEKRRKERATEQDADPRAPRRAEAAVRLQRDAKPQAGLGLARSR